MQDHSVGVAVAEPDGNLDVSKGSSDVIDDAIEQCLEIEGGGDEMCRPLELHEGLNELARGVDALRNSVTRLNRSWGGVHQVLPWNPLQSGLDNRCVVA